MTRSIRPLALVFAVAVAACSDASVPGSDAAIDAGADAQVDAAIDAPPDAPPSFTVTVTPAGDGTGTVISTPAGINCGADCGEAYAEGTAVTLIAAAGAGSTFLGWSGAGCGGTGPCVVTVTAPVTVTPMFALNQSLVVTRTGNGLGSVTSVPAGINCGADCSEAFAPGTMVTLTATPGFASIFTGWTGGGCTGTGTCTVTINGAVGVVATFALEQYTLTVTRAGTGIGVVSSAPAGINCGTDCTETYNAGTLVSLTATPGTGVNFDGWSGACTGTGACLITMDAAASVTATFTAVPGTLTVTRSGTGTGTVISSPLGINCGTDCSETFASPTAVVLTATAASGSTFAGWSGGGCSGTGQCVVTVSGMMTVNATFNLTQHTLTVTRAGTGSGSVVSSPAGINCGTDCTELYNFGTVVTLSPVAATGSTFTGWSGACTGIGTCAVTMNTTQSVTATFALATNCDSFTSANSSTIPNWTERAGDWFINGNRIHQTTNGGVYTNVITMNGSTQTNGCGRLTALQVGTPSTQAVGVVLRWTSPTNYVVALVQDNTGAGNFNSIWIYQYPAAANLGSLTNQNFGTSPNVEACVNAGTVTVRVDNNQDGTYETTHTATTTLLGAGLTGVMTHSFNTAPTNTAHADNFCWGP